MTRFWAALALCAVLHALGCAGSSPVQRADEHFARLDGARVPDEIQRWTELTREDAGNSAPVRARAHLHLALLHTHPDNPEPQYGLALEHLRDHEALDPKGAQDPEVRRLRATLEDLSRCVLRGERRKEVSDLLWKEDQEVRRRLDALRQDSRGMSQVVELLVEEELELRRRNEELEATSQKLLRQNAELRETIEQLKKLDLQLEKIRSGTGGQ